MTSHPVLSIHHLSVTLPTGADRSLALDDVSLHIKKNEVLCLVGESGSGKSVMARAIMGLLLSPHLRAEGEIIFQGKNLLHESPQKLRCIRGQKIAMIFQEPMSALNPLMTIGNQIDELLKIHVNLPKKMRKTRILSLMEEVHLQDPERIYHAYPHQISGGQRQRTMIVMALILEPDILIADEPTTALDVTTQAQILTLIKSLQRKRQTGVLFITHDFGVVAEIADHVAIMQQGKLVEQARVERILNFPQHPYSKSLIAAVPKFEMTKPPPPPETPILLEVKALTKSYPSVTPGFLRKKQEAKKEVLKEVDLTLHAGEIVGLIGESGSGKSTLARCITGLLDSDSGRIMLKNQDISQLSRKALRRHRQKIQMIFQDPYASLNPRQNIAQHLIQGPVAQGIPIKQALSNVENLLQQVGLDPFAALRYPHEFSGGQRQRIGIARALALKPDILIADEPVSALDVSMQRQILNLLLDIRDRFGLAILFVTHDLRVAAQICDKMAVMYRGQIVERGSMVDLLTSPQHEYTKNLLAAIPGRSWRH